MKFNDYKYERLDLDKIETDFEKYLNEFKSATTFEEQSRAMKEINDLRNYIETMHSLVYVRHSINTEDEFYIKEDEFFNENMPRISNLVTKYYKELINAKFREELEKVYGNQIFRLAQVNIEVFSEEIMEDMVEENKLISEYENLIASAKIDFEGQIRNLSGMIPFTESKDQSIRKKASEATSKFFKDNEETFDRIYDELVQCRDRMAKKLGFTNFVEMGYKRLGRTDYNSQMVGGYREQVYKDLVPLVAELKDRQRKRLGLKELKYYDEPLEYVTGNATPKGDSKWILENGKTMYSELSKETDEFFTFMTDKELMDLESKKAKMSGGYCTYIPDYKSPFIFSNFNGTSGDIDVLTHEAGHAFQNYCSMDLDLPEYMFPTLEACEIHSMSMEFITWPWMELFFKEEVEKYKFSHLSGAINFIPYGVTVDEFQHFVYENPNATPLERKNKWREIEKKYLPYRDYDDNDFLDSGVYWYRQGHIFANPFYYIDYTLAQVCAFQFWIKFREDRKNAWEDYLNLCKVGGSLSFVELVKLAKLDNPFEDGTIKKVVAPLKQWLDNIDDKDF